MAASPSTARVNKAPIKSRDPKHELINIKTRKVFATQPMATKDAAQRNWNLERSGDKHSRWRSVTDQVLPVLPKSEQAVAALQYWGLPGYLIDDITYLYDLKKSVFATSERAQELSLEITVLRKKIKLFRNHTTYRDYAARMAGLKAALARRSAGDLLPSDATASDDSELATLARLGAKRMPWPQDGPGPLILEEISGPLVNCQLVLEMFSTSNAARPGSVRNRATYLLFAALRQSIPGCGVGDAHHLIERLVHDQCPLGAAAAERELEKIKARIKRFPKNERKRVDDEIDQFGARAIAHLLYTIFNPSWFPPPVSKA
jgi:hypothetical protein